MSLTPTEFNLLVMDSVLLNSKQYIARCERRIVRAKEELSNMETELDRARHDFQKLSSNVRNIRDSYLSR